MDTSENQNPDNTDTGLSPTGQETIDQSPAKGFSENDHGAQGELPGATQTKPESSDISIENGPSALRAKGDVGSLSAFGAPGPTDPAGKAAREGDWGSGAPEMKARAARPPIREAGPGIGKTKILPTPEKMAGATSEKPGRVTRAKISQENKRHQATATGSRMRFSLSGVVSS